MSKKQKVLVLRATPLQSEGRFNKYTLNKRHTAASVTALIEQAIKKCESVNLTKLDGTAFSVSPSECRSLSITWELPEDFE